MGIVDANPAGFIHGGTVMKLCDEAAALAAIKHSRCRVVTAAVDRMTFLHPVRLGELLTFAPRSTRHGTARWRWESECRLRTRAPASSTTPTPPT